MRDPLKRGDSEFLRSVTEHLPPFLPPDLVADFLAPDVVLVPTPRRAPLSSKDALWPAKLLAEALVRGGLGARVFCCLQRTVAVPKSAYAAPGERPEPQRHYDSMRVANELLDRPQRITLIDDFITKGATLIAAASRIQEAFPDADVRAFALVRTMGLISDIEKIGSPCQGLITCDDYGVYRNP